MWCSPLYRPLCASVPELPVLDGTPQPIQPVHYDLLAPNPPSLPRVAILLPARAADADQIAKNIRQWGSDPNQRPCAEGGMMSGDLHVEHFDVVIMSVQEQTFDLIRSSLPDSVRNCFRRVVHLTLPTTPDSGDVDAMTDDVRAELTMFLHMTRSRWLREFYDFAFLMDSGTIPVRENWLKTLSREVNDPSVFWVKGSLSQSIEPQEQRSGTFWTLNSHILRIHRSALYAVWDPQFESLVEVALKEVGTSGNVKEGATWRYRSDELLSKFVFGKTLRMKQFGHLFVHSVFVVSMPRPFDRSAMSEDTAFVHDALMLPDCKEYDVKGDEQAQSDANCTYCAFHSRNSCDYLYSRAIREREKRPKIPRFAVVMPYHLPHAQKMLQRVRQLDLPDFFPCAEDILRPTRYRSKKIDLILQSSSEGLSLLESAVRSSRAVRACFDDVRLLPFDPPTELDHAHGSSSSFYQLMFGSFMRDSYDYFQIFEPDMQAVRPHWLHRLDREITDTSTFWVKGGLAPEWIKWCDWQGGTRASPLASGEDPIGSCVLHINGNGLYNLWDSRFRDFLRDLGRHLRPIMDPLFPEHLRTDCVSYGDNATIPFICGGHYDTSIASYLLMSRARVHRYAHLYRRSAYVLSRPDFEYLGWSTERDIPANVALTHNFHCGMWWSATGLCEKLSAERAPQREREWTIGGILS